MRRLVLALASMLVLSATARVDGYPRDDRLSADDSLQASHGREVRRQQERLVRGSLQGVRPRRADDCTEGPLRHVHSPPRHRADIEAEVTDLLADGHTGVLGKPGPGEHLLGVRHDGLRRQVLDGKAALRAERRPLVDQHERREEDGRDVQAAPHCAYCGDAVVKGPPPGVSYRDVADAPTRG